MNIGSVAKFSLVLAQLGGVPDLDSGGRRFKSYIPDFYNACVGTETLICNIQVPLAGCYF